MDRIKGSLTAKLGPLPAWAWGILLGIAIIVGRWALARRSESQDVPIDDPGVSGSEGAAGGSGGGAAGVPSAVPNPGSFTPEPIVNTNIDDMAPVDNNQWLSKATTAVVKSTGVTYSAVSDALSKYLAGNAVTPVEESYISRAVAALGYPPGGAPAIIRAGTVGGGAQPPPPPVYNPPGGGNPITAAPIPKFRVRILFPNGTTVLDREVSTAAEVQALRKEYDDANARLAAGQDWGEGGPYTISVT